MDTAIVPEQLLQVLKVMNVETVASQWKIENNGKSINVVLTWDDLTSLGLSSSQRKRDFALSQDHKERQAQDTTPVNDLNMNVVKAETVSQACKGCQTSKVHNKKRVRFTTLETYPDADINARVDENIIASHSSKVDQTSKAISVVKAETVSQACKGCHTSKVHNKKRVRFTTLETYPDADINARVDENIIASHSSKVDQTSKAISVDRFSQISTSVINQEVQTEPTNIVDLDKEDLAALIKKLIHEEKVEAKAEFEEVEYEEAEFEEAEFEEAEFEEVEYEETEFEEAEYEEAEYEEAEFEEAEFEGVEFEEVEYEEGEAEYEEAEFEEAEFEETEYEEAEYEEAEFEEAEFEEAEYEEAEFEEVEFEEVESEEVEYEEGEAEYEEEAEEVEVEVEREAEEEEGGGGTCMIRFAAELDELFDKLRREEREKRENFHCCDDDESFS